MNRTQSALATVLATALLAGCAGNAPKPSDTQPTYQFDLAPTGNPDGAPSAFHDGHKTYFLLPPDGRVIGLHACNQPNHNIPVGREMPYWVTPRIASCWQIKTDKGVFRLARKDSAENAEAAPVGKVKQPMVKSKVGPKKTKPFAASSTTTFKPQASPILAGNACSVDQSLINGLKAARQKLEQLDRLLDRIAGGQCEKPTGMPATDMPNKVVLSVPIRINEQVPGDDALPVIRSIAALSKGAKKVVLTGHAGGKPPNEWLARMRAQAVKRALIENGLEESLIQVIKQDPPPAGIRVNVEIIR